MAKCVKRGCTSDGDEFGCCYSHSDLCRFPTCENSMDSDEIDGFCSLHEDRCQKPYCTSRQMMDIGICMGHFSECRFFACSEPVLRDGFCGSHQGVCIKPYCDAPVFQGLHCAGHSISCMKPYCSGVPMDDQRCVSHYNTCGFLYCKENTYSNQFDFDLDGDFSFNPLAGEPLFCFSHGG